MAESYSVQAILSAVDKNFSSVFHSAQKSLSGITGTAQTATSSIAKIASGIGVFKAVSAATSLLASSVDGAIDRYDTLSKYPKVLGQLGYSTQEAAASTKKLKDGIQGLPTTLDDVVGTARNLTILTGNLEKSTDTTLALNNAFLASGASTADASRGLTQYVQMLSKGTVDIVSWRTLQETMGYALREVAKEFDVAGGSVDGLYAALQDGTITFDEFNDKLIECSECTGGFADMALESCKGIKTSFTNVKTAVTSGIETMLRAIETGLKNSGLPKIADMLDTLKGKIYDIFGTWDYDDNGLVVFNGGISEIIANCRSLQTVLQQTGAVLSSTFLVAGAVPYLKALPAQISTGITSLNNLKAAFAEKLDVSVFENGLSELMKSSGKTREQIERDAESLARSYRESGMDASEAMQKALSDMGLRTQNVATRAKAAFYSATQNARKFAADVKTVFQSTGSIAQELLPDFVVAHLKDAGADIASDVGGALAKLKSIANNVSTAFSELPSSVNGLEPLIGKLKNIGGAASTGAKAGLSAIGKLGSAATSTWSAALKVVGPAAIMGLVVAGIGLVGTQFGDQINSILSTVTTQGPQVIQNFVNGIVSRLPELMNTGSEILANLLTAITANLPTIISGGMQIITALVSGIVNNVQTIAPAALEILVTFINTVVSAIPQIIMLGLTLLQSLAQGLLSGNGNLVTSILSVLQNLVITILSYLPQMLVMGLNLLASLAMGIVQNLPAIIASGVAMITALISGIGEMLPDILSAGWEIIKALGKGILEAIPKILTSVIDGLKSIFRGLLGDINTDIDEGATQIEQRLAEMDETVGNCTYDMSVTAGNNTAAMCDQILDNTEAMSDGVAVYVESAAENTDAYLHQGAAAGTAAAAELSSGVVGEASGMSEAMGNILSGISTDGTLSFDNLTNGGTSAMDLLSSNVTSTTANMSEETLSLLAGMTEEELAALNGTAASVSEIVTGMSEAIGTSFSGMTDTVSLSMMELNSVVMNGMTAFSEVIASGTQAINANWADAFAGIPETVELEMARAEAAAATGVANVTAVSSSGMEQTSHAWAAAFTGIADTVKKQLSNVQTTVTSNMSKVQSSVSKRITQIGTVWKTAFTGMAETVKSKMSEAVSSTSNGMASMTRAVVSGMNQATAAARTGANNIVSAFSGLYSQLYSSGMWAMAGLQSGLNARAGSVYATARSIANSVASIISSALKVGSPSRVLMRIGEFAGEGLEIGLLNLLSDVERASSRLAQAAMPVVAVDFSGVEQAHAGTYTVTHDITTDKWSVLSELRKISDKLDAVCDRTYQLETQVNLDGREIAKATANYTQAELDKRQARDSRKRGRL